MHSKVLDFIASLKISCENYNKGCCASHYNISLGNKSTTESNSSEKINKNNNNNKNVINKIKSESEEEEKK